MDDLLDTARISQGKMELRKKVIDVAEVIERAVDSCRSSVEGLLKIAGHELRVAYDGPTALALATTFQPKVVLLDIGIPGLSGYEVAERLRQTPETTNARLVAITGWGQPEDRERSNQEKLGLTTFCSNR
jgi:CheY-like chemotaxis protein